MWSDFDSAIDVIVDCRFRIVDSKTSRFDFSIIMTDFAASRASLRNSRGALELDDTLLLREREEMRDRILTHGVQRRSAMGSPFTE
jgi:hypothetical protein